MTVTTLTDKQKQIVAALRKRYAAIPEVLFQRSLALCQDEVELFDVLDTMLDSYPLVWDKTDRRWRKVSELLGGEFSS